MQRDEITAIREIAHKLIKSDADALKFIPALRADLRERIRDRGFDYVAAETYRAAREAVGDELPDLPPSVLGRELLIEALVKLSADADAVYAEIYSRDLD